MRESMGIPEMIWSKLREIPSTQRPFHSLPYRPASIQLTNGERLECVIFFGKETFARLWSKEEQERTLVNMNEVLEVQQSKYQLLPQFAYRGVETRDGTMMFALTMKDRKRFLCETGRIEDFIVYPKGYGSTDVLSVDVDLNSVKNKTPFEKTILHAPNYSLCLFQESESCLERVAQEPMIV